MPVNIDGKQLITPLNGNSNLFHLSYDKKEGIDSVTLKKEIVWEILIEQGSYNHYIDSPNETVIVFESNLNFLWWFRKLFKCFENKMCFELSEVISSESARGTRYFHANKYPCPDKTSYFNDNFVTPVKNDIDNEQNPTTKCP